MTNAFKPVANLRCIAVYTSTVLITSTGSIQYKNSVQGLVEHKMTVKRLHKHKPT